MTFTMKRRKEIIMNRTDLLKALYDWQEENCWTDSKVCRALRISKTTYVNWKQRGSLSLKGASKIKQFLESQQENPEGREGVPVFPVISDAAAASVNTAYQPITDFAKKYAEEYTSFTKGRQGDFVIKVSGDSMAPWYPDGTLLLVRPNAALRNGDRVIAVLADGSILFKVFAEDDTSFYLFSENRKEGKDFMFAKNDFNGVRALYLVVQSMRDERALDMAKEQQGIRSDIMSRIKKIRQEHSAE